MTKKIPAHIQFSNINKNYSKKHFGFFTHKKTSKTILHDAEVELKGGECILLTGKNGSGKSTLLRILAGLLKPDSATINTGLEALSWKQSRKLLREQIMYLHQEPYMFDGTVSRNLEYAVQSKEPSNQIKKALKWANLEHRAETSAKCLSGGEKQRVALAQAWLKQPSVLLLDEPTANMDDESRRSTQEILNTFKQMGMALLIASHDINHFHNTMDKRLLLEHGEISELKNTAILNIGTFDDRIALFPQRKV